MPISATAPPVARVEVRRGCVPNLHLNDDPVELADFTHPRAVPPSGKRFR